MSGAEPSELPYLQRRVLELLQGCPGALTFSEVAVELRLGRGPAVSALEDLVQRRLVERIEPNSYRAR